MSSASRGSHTTGSGPGAGVDPKEYLRLLNEKNQILRRLKEQGVSVEQKAQEQRKTGFTTLFSGANSARRQAAAANAAAANGKTGAVSKRTGDRKTWNRTTAAAATAATGAAASTNGSNPSSPANAKTGASRNGNRPRRKNWALTSLVIKGDDGQEVRLKPVNGAGGDGSTPEGGSGDASPATAASPANASSAAASTTASSSATTTTATAGTTSSSTVSAGVMSPLRTNSTFTFPVAAAAAAGSTSGNVSGAGEDEYGDEKFDADDTELTIKKSDLASMRQSLQAMNDDESAHESTAAESGAAGSELHESIHVPTSGGGAGGGASSAIGDSVADASNVLSTSHDGGIHSSVTNSPAPASTAASAAASPATAAAASDGSAMARPVLKSIDTDNKRADEQNSHATLLSPAGAAKTNAPHLAVSASPLARPAAIRASRGGGGGAGATLAPPSGLASDAASVALSSSFDSRTVQSLLARFRTLTKPKRLQLMRALETLEAGDWPADEPTAAAAATSAAQPTAAGTTAATAATNGASSSPVPPASSSSGAHTALDILETVAHERKLQRREAAAAAATAATGTSANGGQRPLHIQTQPNPIITPAAQAPASLAVTASPKATAGSRLSPQKVSTRNSGGGGSPAVSPSNRAMIAGTAAGRRAAAAAPPQLQTQTSTASPAASPPHSPLGAAAPNLNRTASNTRVGATPGTGSAAAVTLDPAPTAAAATANPLTITVRALGSWGHTHLIGLTELELFDRNGKKILIPPSALTVLHTSSTAAKLGLIPGVAPPIPDKATGNGGTGSVSVSRAGIDRLVNGKSMTTSERHMWITTFPEPASTSGHTSVLDVVVACSAGVVPCALRVWNYNAPLPNDTAKGVKEAVVLVNGVPKWRGRIQKGCGAEELDYSTDILLFAANSPIPRPAGTSTAANTLTAASPTPASPTARRHHDAKSLPLPSTLYKTVQSITPIPGSAAVTPSAANSAAAGAANSNTSATPMKSGVPLWLAQPATLNPVHAPTAAPPVVAPPGSLAASASVVRPASRSNSPLPSLDLNVVAGSTASGGGSGSAGQVATIAPNGVPTSGRRSRLGTNRRASLSNDTSDAAAAAATAAAAAAGATPASIAAAASAAAIAAMGQSATQPPNPNLTITTAHVPPHVSALALPSPAHGDGTNTPSNANVNTGAAGAGGPPGSSRSSSRNANRRTFPLDYTAMVQQASAPSSGAPTPSAAAGGTSAVAPTSAVGGPVPATYHPSPGAVARMLGPTSGAGVPQVAGAGVDSKSKASPRDPNRRGTKQRVLEESWDSLAFFQQTHQGRLHQQSSEDGDSARSARAAAAAADDSHAAAGASADLSASVQPTAPAAAAATTAAPAATTAATATDATSYVPSSQSSAVGRRRSIELRKGEPIAASNPPVAAPNALSDLNTQPASASASTALTAPVPRRPSHGIVAAGSSIAAPTANPGSSVSPVPPELALPGSGSGSGSGGALTIGVPPSAGVQGPPPVAFSIPHYPSGQTLTFTIHSTWGDPHYVGLSGIELFDENARPIRFRDRNAAIQARPANINVLAGYGKDPRVVANLLDGVNCTCDDLHVWLAPFTPGKHNIIAIEFEPLESGASAGSRARTLSMIRIWNFNKSRIHSARGVRDITIRMDSSVIFHGEIGQAPGNIHLAPQHAECILFTTDARITHKLDEFTREQQKSWAQQSGHHATSATTVTVSANRASGPLSAMLSGAASMSGGSNFGFGFGSGMSGVSEDVIPERANRNGDRPRTANEKNDQPTANAAAGGDSGAAAMTTVSIDAVPANSTLDQLLNGTVPNLTMIRPHTSAIIGAPNRLSLPGDAKGTDSQPGSKRSSISVDRSVNGAAGSGDDNSAGSTPRVVDPVPSYYTGTVLTIIIVKTWGDPHFVGLTGLELIGVNETDGSDEKVVLTASALSAYPQDLNSVPGHSGDNRTLDKLIDGANVTCDDNHMWLAPFLNPEWEAKNVGLPPPPAAPTLPAATAGGAAPNPLAIASATAASALATVLGTNPVTGATNPGQWLRVTLSKPTKLKGFKIWNYNKAVEDTYRGMKWIKILLDDQLISPVGSTPAVHGGGAGGYLIRKALGNTDFDFMQTVRFRSVPAAGTGAGAASARLKGSKSAAVLKSAPPATPAPALMSIMDYVLPTSPTGFLLKFVLISTWGDPHYIGLNGIELFDINGQPIRVPGTGTVGTLPGSTAAAAAMALALPTASPLSSAAAAVAVAAAAAGGAGGGYGAVPSSVRVLAGMEHDSRTVDKLFDGHNMSRDDRHCWLAPFSPTKPTVIYVWFDAAVSLSLIRITNYAKTPHRGVADLQIYFDDLIIFDGYLRRAPDRGDTTAELIAESIVLTPSAELYAREERFLPKLTGTEQEVLYIDERRVVSQPSASPSVYPAQRPMTSNASASNRPSLNNYSSAASAAAAVQAAATAAAAIAPTGTIAAAPVASSQTTTAAAAASVQTAVGVSSTSSNSTTAYPTTQQIHIQSQPQTQSISSHSHAPHPHSHPQQPPSHPHLKA